MYLKRKESFIMKLSTYTKQFRKFYNSSDCVTVFLCIALNRYSYTISLKTENPKLQAEYESHRELCKQFIDSAIEGCYTVVDYLNSKGADLYSAREFRLNLLNDMVDWAESQEDSHQL